MPGFLTPGGPRKSAMPKYYFEDFRVGETMPLSSRCVTEEEIIAFARQFDPQPFHADPEAARSSIYGGLIASGWHTCCLVMRLMCDGYLLETASLGSPGMDEIRWLKPVRPGDTIRGEQLTLDAHVSKSKPDRGVVHSAWRIYNQNDELIMTMRGMVLFSRRAA